MARPVKRRNVCSMPKHNLFGPLAGNSNQREILIMPVDEYETIRLIDLEGLSQEEAAEKMNIARTSAQRIYNNARQKLAEALVNGKILSIEGGSYRLCEDGSAHCHGRRGCPRKGEMAGRSGGKMQGECLRRNAKEAPVGISEQKAEQQEEE